MTLRSRMVLGLVALVTAGLAMFGFATYSLYAHSEYQRLDDQLRSAQNQITPTLQRQAAGADADNNTGFGGGGPGGPPDRGLTGGGGNGAPPIAYAELRDASGTVLSHYTPPFSDVVAPTLPTKLPTPTGTAHFLTFHASNGSGTYRVLVASVAGGSRVVVVAAPVTEVTDALHRLVLIEALAAILLLAALSTGSWFVLRRGLRPLEHMAGTARAITGGDLSLRVSPAGGGGEVGQLGLALNTMLDDIEAAFREREETEQRLRQFLADASHELRTPLTSIQGFAELFRVSGENARVDLPTILRRIEQETARMKGLVEDLLLLARLDQTRATERIPVDLTVLAADACSDAVAVERGRPITLVAPEPVVVAGDQAHLRQAIANLVNNALRHTPPGTAVEVGAHLAGGEAFVSVHDHGTGLDEEALVHVFDRFWQADRARAGSGAGLGLAIVAGIAAEHGGEVSAANAPDGGAVFTIRLPLTAPALSS